MKLLRFAVSYNSKDFHQSIASRHRNNKMRERKKALIDEPHLYANNQSSNSRNSALSNLIFLAFSSLNLLTIQLAICKIPSCVTTKTLL